jgi:Na+/melibiose symporter-like transporter
MILQIFLTNSIGIAATTVGFLFLVIKFWDAVNDPIFGVIIDKAHLKGGKFIPWLRLSAILLPITTILLFFCPPSLTEWIKVLWIGLAYILWDAVFTFNDAPLYGVPLAMTDNTKERTFMIFLARLSASFGFLLAALIPQLTIRMGYGPAILIASVVAMIFMLPFSYIGKERYPVRSAEEPSIKSMLLYVVRNKQMLIFFLAIFIKSAMDLTYVLMMYVAVYSLGDPNLMSLNMILISVPGIAALLLQITLLKNAEKFTTFTVFSTVGILLTALMYFVALESVTVYVVLLVLRMFFTTLASSMSSAFVADCTIYGAYKTGIHAEGVSFSIMTFMNKIAGAIPGAMSMFILGALGYVSSIGGGFPEQPQAVVDGIWILFTWATVIAYAIQLLLMLFFYRLRDKNVKIMSDCNNGLISREEAEKLLPANL